jgi:hypothetical protein
MRRAEVRELKKVLPETVKLVLVALVVVAFVAVNAWRVVELFTWSVEGNM